MTNQEHIDSTPQEVPEELATSVPEEKRQDEIPVYSYDPSRIGTLSAQQMDDIEARAWHELDAGVPEEQVQAHIYDSMSALGFDLSQAHDNGLAIRFTGIDGKTDTRVINLSSNDFGVRIQKAQLMEVPQEPAQEAGEETDDVSQEVEAIRGDLTEVSNKLAGMLEDAATAQLEAAKSVSSVIEGTRQLIRKLEQRQEFKREIGELEALIGEARTKTRINGGASERVNRQAQAAVSIVDRGVRVIATTSKSAEAFSPTIQRARHGLEQLHSLQRAGTQNTNNGMMVLSRLDSIINELQYSRRGADAYADELRGSLRLLGDTGEQGMRVRANLTVAAEQFHTMA